VVNQRNKYNEVRQNGERVTRKDRIELLDNVRFTFQIFLQPFLRKISTKQHPAARNVIPHHGEGKASHRSSPTIAYRTHAPSTY
jgi:hypothetical protein